MRVHILMDLLNALRKQRSNVMLMSAHAFLNLLIELMKRDQMRGLPSIFLFFSQRAQLIPK